MRAVNPPFIEDWRKGLSQRIHKDQESKSISNLERKSSLDSSNSSNSLGFPKIILVVTFLTRTNQGVLITPSPKVQIIKIIEASRIGIPSAFLILKRFRHPILGEKFWFWPNEAVIYILSIYRTWPTQSFHDVKPVRTLKPHEVGFGFRVREASRIVSSGIGTWFGN